LFEFQKAYGESEYFIRQAMKAKSTIQKEVHLSGVGIHSGEKADIFLKPSSRGEIVFRRSDLGNLELLIDPKKTEAENSTSLVSKDCKIQTVEHLLAVLYMFGIDSLVIELNGPEIPAMDGSASPFVQAVVDAGVRRFHQKKKVAKILKPFTVEQEDAFLCFFPDPGFRITYSIEYDHPLIRKQELSLELNLERFIREVAPARTFGFLKDVPSLRSRGLAAGGSLDNAVILDEKGVVSGPLRYPDEFVRHKILDLIGDLSLFGSPLLGHFKAHRAGHNLHLKAVRFLLDNPEFWTYEKKGTVPFY
jgi:UDP-3-O-[3-hydroxymyristoyl] N-acetylglucosamine deacetylase